MTGVSSLNGGTDTLSGGEAQRIKIARYINSPLTDMMSVLDEPSVGLHARDIQKLKISFDKLKEHGNTAMIVNITEKLLHLWIILWIWDRSRYHGGQIMYQGNYKALESIQ